MITFKEFMNLNESPNGHEGEWSGDDEMRMLGVTLRQDVVENRYKLMDTIDDIRFLLKKSKDGALAINKENKVVL
jgi:hypothetical protein